MSREVKLLIMNKFQSLHWIYLSDTLVINKIVRLSCRYSRPHTQGVRRRWRKIPTTLSSSLLPVGVTRNCAGLTSHNKSWRHLRIESSLPLPSPPPPPTPKTPNSTSNSSAIFAVQIESEHQRWQNPFLWNSTFNVPDSGESWTYFQLEGPIGHCFIQMQISGWTCSCSIYTITSYEWPNQMLWKIEIYDVTHFLRIKVSPPIIHTFE